MGANGIDVRRGCEELKMMLKMELKKLKMVRVEEKGLFLAT